MKKHALSLSLTMIFFVGFSILMYPFISNYLNSLNQSKIVREYRKSMEEIRDEDSLQCIEAARQYNIALQAGPAHFHSGKPQDEAYLAQLRGTETDVMGYITIKRIGVQLPIYHGTSEEVLAVGVGHLEGSSMPVGGKGTHAVLTGHRGLPSSSLFTNLDKIRVGNLFTITVLNQTKVYRVDKISIVEPEDTSLIEIDLNHDYVTLVTCTPYGVNTW